MEKVGRKLGIVGAAAAASVVLYVLLPGDMGELARRAVGICVFAAALWATEAIPLFATSLCVIGLEILLLARHGGLAGAGELRYSQFLESFASSTIILFMGGFLIAAAATKHQLDRAIASRLLRPFMGNSTRLIVAVTFISGCLSMWMSNTATTAMMLAIIAPLMRDEKADRRLVGALALAAAFGANIGGIATPIGTPPNAVAIAALRADGIGISFVQWMEMAMPPSMVMMFVAAMIIIRVMRPPRDVGVAPVEAPSHLPWRGKATFVVMLAAIAAWLTGPLHGVDDAVVALLAATLLAVLGVLDAGDVRQIEWDVLLLMWGGLALGHGLQLTDVLDYAVKLEIFHQSGWVLALIVMVGGIMTSTVMCNTAAVNLLVPFAIALSAGHSGRLAIIAAMAASFAMALPISTPPNAMAFATGRFSSRDMLIAGSLVSLVALSVLMAGYLWALPWVLKID